MSNEIFNVKYWVNISTAGREADCELLPHFVLRTILLPTDSSHAGKYTREIWTGLFYELQLYQIII